MIRHADATHSVPNLRFATCDIAKTPIQPPASLAFGIDVVHHVHDLDGFVSGVRRSLVSRGIWFLVEPNIWNPYITGSIERMRRQGLDEDHFRPWIVEPAVRRAGFTIDERRYRFAVPGWIDEVPPIVERIESALEGFRVIGGSVAYRLIAPD